MHMRKSRHRSATRNKILIVSDLHLTSGKDYERGVWSPTEDFFWDQELKAFLEYYGKESGATLIINGDLVDFLQVLVRPSSEESELYGIPPADVSAVYGLKTSEAASVYQVDKVVDGHPVAFQALADWLARGNSVVLLKGNHDVQLFWEAPRERLRQRVLELCSPKARTSAERLFQILPWVYYIPGLLYVEHGNQYESATSFQNFLYPVLPFDTPGAGRHIELDLGGIVVRYFANRMEVVNLLSDNIRPLSSYVVTFIRRHPLVSLSMAGTVLSYLVNAFTKSARTGGHDAIEEAIRIGQANTALIDEEAVRLAGRTVGVRDLQEKLRARDQRKARPALSDGPLRLAWRMFRTPMHALCVLLPLISLFFTGDLAAVVARIAVSAGAGLVRDFLDAMLFLKVPQILLIAVAVWFTALLGRGFLRARTRARDERDVPIQLRREAGMIAREMDVRYVVFGHTHKEDVLRLPGNRWYFNTGTWISVYSADENMVRAPQQCSYLEISDRAARLRYWDSASQSPADAVVVDPEVAHAPAEEDMASLVRKALRIPWKLLGGRPSRARLDEFLRSRLRKSAGRGKGT